MNKKTPLQVNGSQVLDGQFPLRQASRLNFEATSTSLPRAFVQQATVFENQIPLMTITEFCSRFGYSKKTIYDWKYRPKKNGIPANLVVKIRGKIFIRTDIYRDQVLLFAL